MNLNQFEQGVAIVKQAVNDFRIDLKSKNIIVELGSNAYFFTPLIPYFSKASKIFVWIKDSQYGMADKLASDFTKFCDQIGIDLNSFEFSLNQLNCNQISRADIVCNLWSIRPLDFRFLENLTPKSVISLMYDKWELRADEIDLEYCKSKSIKIGGTWEGHPKLNVFKTVGSLAIKMFYEANCEIYKKKIIVWSDDDFGKVVSKSLKYHGASKVVVTRDFSDLILIAKDVDSIFFCSYYEERKIIGANGFFDVEKILAVNTKFKILHLYGDIDYKFLENRKICVYPPKNGKAKVMSYTLAHLGNTPTIWLNAAGIKVAEYLMSNKKNSLLQRIV